MSEAPPGFDELVASLDYPLFVVTVASGGERSGCLVGFATQCSIKPPRVLVCLSVKNHTYGVAADATHLGVHALRPDDRALAERFGGETGDEIDKFADIEWRAGPAGAPLLHGPAWFVGRILDRVDLGDHVGHVLEPVAVGRADALDEQLGFQEAKDIDPGHEP
ncbi:MAG TPA: flavin reductase family protein [Acidimicrobiales bacterium]|nr:flavin reductase family protein [Acidimicrobiales bacterium]